MSSNIRQFIQTVQAVGKDSKKPFAEIVNKALKNVGFRAMQFTPYADPGQIQAELYHDDMLLKIATSILKGNAGREIIDKHGNSKLTKGGRARRYRKKVTRQQIAALASKLLRIRIAGSRAARAGWIPAVRSFGGSVRGDAKQRPGTTTANGGGTRANPGKLSGRIWNALITRSRKTRSKVPVERIIGAVSALDKAVKYVTADMRSHAEKRGVEAVLRKYSDR